MRFLFLAAFAFLAVPAISQTLVDYGGMDDATFVHMVQDPSVERIVFESPKNDSRTIYFLFGYLEEKWTNYEYGYALYPIRALQNAGWRVVVDGWTTAAEANTYFNSPDNVATYWSSHGTPQGDLITWQDATHYAVYDPAKIKSSGKNLKFALFCACYSLKKGTQYASALNNASIYGFHTTVTPQDCASQLKFNFIKLFNAHF